MVWGEWGKLCHFLTTLSSVQGVCHQLKLGESIHFLKKKEKKKSGPEIQLYPTLRIYISRKNLKLNENSK